MMKHALEGIKVLDFSHLLQGPFATQMLGDLGADVIKIEKPVTGDLMRQITFMNYSVGGEESPCYLAWNRNKRSLALNLKSEEAKQIIYRLAGECDIVVENFRPGVMEKLGFGYETLQSINPRLIYCSGSGYGRSGPYAGRPGQDLLLQALTGLTTVTGRSDEPPTPLGTSIADQLGSYHMVYGILAALYYREKTGKGQRVDVDLFSCLVAHQSQEFVLALNRGEEFERPRSGIAHPGMPAPFGIYRTADGWLAVAMNPMQVLSEVLEDPELMKWNDPETLYRNRDEVYQRLQHRIVAKPTAEWLQRMLARDIWCGEVKSHLQVAEDPQAKHMGLFTAYSHPKAGKVTTVNIPVRFSETPGAIAKHPPSVGEHSKEILIELGLSEEEIEQLAKNRIISCCKE